MSGDSSKKQASILTDSQLRYLDPRDDYKPSNPSNYNRRIRDRIEWGLFDLGMLYRYLDEEQRRKVFGPHYGNIIESKEDESPVDEVLEENGWKPNPEEEGSMARSCVPGALKFLLWGLSSEGEPAFAEFESMLEDATRWYLSDKLDLHADVEVSIDISNPQPNDDWLDDFSDE